MSAVGLVVNPCAGLGGEVALHGSDGPELQGEARRRGAIPRASARAEAALRRLRASADLEIVTVRGEMGEIAARRAGLMTRLVDITPGDPTTAEDTIRSARALQAENVDLLMFAGGDGTAKDLVDAVDIRIPTLGIPAGVKIQSACYAVTPEAAGDAARAFLADPRRSTTLREVLDHDEDGASLGRLSPRVVGVLLVPEGRGRLQAGKAPPPSSAAKATKLAAAGVVARMEPGVRYVLGPGTTTAAISAEIGCQATLLGVDVVQDRRLLAADVTEAQLLALIAGTRAVVVVTVIGGQGFLFGRGNQQISARVLRAVGEGNVWVVADEGKLAELGGRSLLVDTGDQQTDDLLSGPIRVISGPSTIAMRRLAPYR